MGGEADFNKYIYRYFPENDCLVCDEDGAIEMRYVGAPVQVHNGFTRDFYEFLKSETCHNYVPSINEFMDIICGGDYVLYFGIDDDDDHFWLKKFMVIISFSIGYDAYLNKFD